MYCLERFDGRCWQLVFSDDDEGNIEAERDELIEEGGVSPGKLRIRED